MADRLRWTVFSLLAKAAAREVDSVSISNSLVDDLGFDSLMLISLIVDLEQELRIEIPPDDLVTETFSTVGSVETYLEGLTSRNPGERLA